MECLARDKLIYNLYSTDTQHAKQFNDFRALRIVQNGSFVNIAYVNIAYANIAYVDIAHANIAYVNIAIKVTHSGRRPGTRTLYILL